MAYTYNEPLIGYEYVRDSSKLVHDRGMKNILVTNGTASIEELEAVCEAFAAKDPNGNGQPDEIPILGGINVSKGNIPMWIINNFIYVNDNYLYDVDDDGKIFLPYDRDEYRQGIRAVRELYKKNYISSLSWTISEKSELTAIFTPADRVAKVGVIGAHMLTNTEDGNPVLYEYEYLEPFAGAYAPHGPLALSFGNFITADCEHPEAAFDLLCTLASPEGTRRQRYGEKDVDWHFVTDYATGREGVEVLNGDAFSGQTSSTWSISVNTTYWKVPDGDTTLDPQPVFIANPNPPGEETWALTRTNKNVAHAEAYMEHAAQTDPKYLLFDVAYTDEENEELGRIKSEIGSFVTASRAQFITGELDIDSDAEWQKYCDTLHGLGTETAIRIAQTAWDRMQAAADGTE